MTYSQCELDHMDKNTYDEYLFWSGQIPGPRPGTKTEPSNPKKGHSMSMNLSTLVDILDSSKLPSGCTFNSFNARMYLAFKLTNTLGEQKITTIKVFKALTGLGLKDSKAFVDIASDTKKSLQKIHDLYEQGLQDEQDYDDTPF